MLQQPLYSLFIRLFPEAFLLIYSISLLTNSKVNLKKIFISGIIGGIGVYIARLLPVHFGVHTIIAIMLYIILAVKINNIEIYKAIAATLVALILLFISDLMIVFVYTKIFLLSSEVVLGKTWVASVAGIPSLIIYYLIISLISHIKNKRTINEQY